MLDRLRVRVGEHRMHPVYQQVEVTQGAYVYAKGLRLFYYTTSKPVYMRTRIAHPQIFHTQFYCV